ncbi:MAG: hypothetical protein LC114_00375 [Bryobacterales bacterium]|nr:hypothetical protein [Bryobacterales bacterium]
MATNASNGKNGTVKPAPDANGAAKPKSSDLVLMVKVILFSALFIAALWALDHFAMN